MLETWKTRRLNPFMVRDLVNDFFYEGENIAVSTEHCRVFVGHSISLYGQNTHSNCISQRQNAWCILRSDLLTLNCALLSLLPFTYEVYAFP